MIQMYESLGKYLNSSSIWNMIELKFIDVTRDKIRDCPYALSVLLKGYAIPLVAINGRVKFYGGIPYEGVYQEAVTLIRHTDKVE